MTNAVEQVPGGITRRKMVGFLIAGPTLVAGASLGRPAQARGAVPTVQPVDKYDLSDLLLQSTLPTNHLITVTVNEDGTVSFALPRSENGQGITTACAQVIADEMDLPIERIRITLSDANPDLVWNQLTGGSASMMELWDPLRTASATARDQMLAVAAQRLGVPKSGLTVADGVISGGGRSLGYGELARFAAVPTSRRRLVHVKPKRKADLRLVGRG
ncbi:MAG: isoquinoline 1-oxidoreductase subunit beta, partial [Solirubrobacteraceae bacterium]|nr:isoquinoline 1-oxidoreductase subunit beta [Solirubrobacteraceae bacterium]